MLASQLVPGIHCFYEALLRWQVSALIFERDMLIGACEL
jgi:hypothetical protein